MGFRIAKLCRMLREEGVRPTSAFLAKDIYFRALQFFAFPLHQKAKTGKTWNGYELFISDMQNRPTARVLEIGSRAVSDTTQRSRFSPPVQYFGMDLLPGPNVDIVGDAHELSRLFPENHFDGVFSQSVFEHLLMPWKVVLEINKILKLGGLVLIGTHPTWPPHELPWDFWRFQENSFWSLFNRATGFELVGCSTSDPARLFPEGHALHLSGTIKTICPMGVVALAKKVAAHDSRLAWPVTVKDITLTSYPKK
jgi:SAM-dependent methyltransferase